MLAFIPTRQNLYIPRIGGSKYFVEGCMRGGVVFKKKYEIKIFLKAEVSGMKQQNHCVDIRGSELNELFRREKH